MNRIALLLVITLMAFSFQSCEPDELDEPTNVSLQIALTDKGPINNDDNGDDDDEDDNGSDKNLSDNKPGLSISGGSLHISEIDFEGTRENADDYFFTRSFNPYLTANFNSNQLDQPVEFKVPQGNYTRVKITIHLTKTDTSEALILNGKYSIGNAKEQRVEMRFFEYDDESVELILEDNSGNKEIAFTKSKNREIEIQYRLSHMFRTFNPGQMTQAVATETPKGETIIISQNQNNNLYFQLVSRIQKSFKAVIK